MEPRDRKTWQDARHAALAVLSLGALGAIANAFDAAYTWLDDWMIASLTMGDILLALAGVLAFGLVALLLPPR